MKSARLALRWNGSSDAVLPDEEIGASARGPVSGTRQATETIGLAADELNQLP